MKKVFIYYSHTGNGDFVADILKEKEFEIRKIDTEKKVLPNPFFFKKGVRRGGKSRVPDWGTDINLIEILDVACEFGEFRG